MLLYSISEEISVSDINSIRFASVFDTHLFVFITEAIRIRICIQVYPCLNPNLIENTKTNTISVISIYIRSASLFLSISIVFRKSFFFPFGTQFFLWNTVLTMLFSENHNCVQKLNIKHISLNLVCFFQFKS